MPGLKAWALAKDMSIEALNAEGPQDEVLFGVGKVEATQGDDAPKKANSYGGGWALGEVLRQRRRTGRIRTMEGELTLWDVHRRGERKDITITSSFAVNQNNDRIFNSKSSSQRHGCSRALAWIN